MRIIINHTVAVEQCNSFVIQFFFLSAPLLIYRNTLTHNKQKITLDLSPLTIVV